MTRPASAQIDQYVLRSLADWRFYFNQAKASMGIRGIDYEALAMSIATPASSRGIPEKRLAAARRHSSIEARLLLLPPPSLRIVRVTCEDSPREQWEPFYAGGLGNVANLTSAAMRAHALSRSSRDFLPWLDRLGEKLKRGRATTEERLLRERISKDIEGVIAKVHHEYEDARRHIG